MSWVWASFKVLKNALNAYLQSKTGSVTVSIMQVYLRGASKIKLKSMYKKRMATARRQIFFGVSQDIADLITLLFSSLQNSEGSGNGISGDSFADPCQFLPFLKTII